jgi:hypothetical protein
MKQNGAEGLFSSYGSIGGHLLRLALLRRCGTKRIDDGEVLE